jgi:hypothetical protein
MKVNDILVCEWGATMTLYDFYKVKKVLPKSVVIVEVGSEKLGGQMWELEVRPQPSNEIGPLLTRRLLDGYVKGRHACQYVKTTDIWDGSETYLENHMD